MKAEDWVPERGNWVQGQGQAGGGRTAAQDQVRRKGESQRELMQGIPHCGPQEGTNAPKQGGGGRFPVEHSGS